MNVPDIHTSPVAPKWCTLAAAAFLAIPHAWAGAPSLPQAPAGLLVDLHPRPLAVEDLESPRFSWEVRDPRRGARQAARQILVATHPDLLTPEAADVWDSGRVGEASSAAVAYSGPPLSPATRYFWTVRTWDESGVAGPFAPPAEFATALKDQWDAVPIWAAEGGERHDWQDVTIAFDFIIHNTAASVWFRAANPASNYMWQFDANANTLRRHVFHDGNFRLLEVRELGFELEPETRYQVTIQAHGPAIRTFINGNLIDETEDDTFAAGNVGFRHGNHDEATYANLTIKDADGSMLFESDLMANNPFPRGNLTAHGVRFGRNQSAMLPTGDGGEPDDGFPGSGTDWALMRTDFQMPDKPVAHATLYAAAVCPVRSAQYIYRAMLNGRLIGVGPTRGYDGMNFYHAFDVAEHLAPGDNTLAFVAYIASGKALKAQLDIVFADGSRQRVATNPQSWQARDGSDLFLNVGNAGTGFYHAPREYLRADRWPHGFDQPGFDASAWPAPAERPAIQGLTGLPTRNLKQEIRRPVTAEAIGPGAWRLDFHRNVVGGIRLSVNGTAGTHVDVLLGEELNDDGSVRYRMRTRNHYQDRWTLADGPQTLEHFGYRVFRYAELHGLPESVTADDITGVGWVYPFDMEAAAFSSSDPHLDEIWKFSRDSIRLLNMELYMDTPSRERRAYEADAFLQQLAHYALDREFALARFSTEYLFHHYTWPTEWKLTSPSAAWRDYLHTGDLRSASRYYELLRDTKTLDEFLDDRGLVVKHPGGPHRPDSWTDIVDWPVALRDGYVFGNVNTVINAYNHRTMRDLGHLASALGRDDEAESFATIAATTAAAINQYLFDEEAGLYRDGEGIDHHALHASIFPLAFGIATEREAVAAHALAERRIVGNIFSAAFQIEALFSLGRDRDAIDLLTCDGLKSWRNMIRLGAGTTMETWDPSLKPNTTYSHPAGASPAYLIPMGLFGIDAIEPAHRRFTVTPRPGDLESAEIRVPTLSGTILAAIRQSDTHLELQLTVPANTTAEVNLPASDPANITEGGKPLGEIHGIRILAPANDHSTRIEIPAGTYSFTTSR